MTLLGFDVAHRAIRGARDTQEDDVRVHRPSGADTLPVIVALADGMGGHAAGEVAAETSCETFVSSIGDASGDWARDARAAVEAANARVGEMVAADKKLDGMGATLVGALFDKRGLQWISVGDSPLFLVRDKDIERVNADHSLAPLLDEMAARGEMTPERAASDPRRQMLLSAVTGEDLEEVDLSARPLELVPGDVVVVASDGIESLPPDEIARVASGYRGDGSAAAADALLRAVDAMQHPRQDNATVVVAIPRFD
ncbi:MAG: protein phosphatase 2C domain-containing protein [Pseudomonadota bacterium]